MNLKRSLAVALRQFYLLRGSPVRILPVFAWIGIDIVLWGFISRYLNTVTSTKFSFVPALLGAVLLWDFLVRVMQGITTTLLEDVWSRNFLNVFATPLTIAEYAAGLVISSVVTSTAALLVVLVLAGVAFGLSYFVFGLLIIPLVMSLFVFGVALGIFGCYVLLRFGPAAEWLIWPIPAVLAPLACVYYPLAALPAWMQILSRAIPPSYVFEALRTAVRRGSVSGWAILEGFALAVLYVLLAGWCFTRAYKRVVQTGLIARYSAESL